MKLIKIQYKESVIRWQKRTELSCVYCVSVVFSEMDFDSVD